MGIAETRQFWKEQVKLSKTKPQKNVKPLRYPFVVEMSYQQFIKRNLRKFITEVRSMIDPEISGLVKLHKQEMRLDSVSADRAKEIFERASNELLTGVNEQWLSADLMSQAEQINYNNRLQLDRHYKQGLGIIPVTPEPWLKTLMTDFVTANTLSITSVKSDYLEAVKKAVIYGVTSGQSVETLKKNIIARSGISIGRANTIARTATGSMFGQLTKARDLSIGITKFVWFHTTLKNPREQHLLNNGKTFSWNAGDINGDTPGSEFNCRCTSGSDFSQLLD